MFPFVVDVFKFTCKNPPSQIEGFLRVELLAQYELLGVSSPESLWAELAEVDEADIGPASEKRESCVVLGGVRAEVALGQYINSH